MVLSAQWNWKENQIQWNVKIVRQTQNAQNAFLLQDKKHVFHKINALLINFSQPMAHAQMVSILMDKLANAVRKQWTIYNIISVVNFFLYLTPKLLGQYSVEMMVASTLMVEMVAILMQITQIRYRNGKKAW